jgi:monoamine oxidase
VGGTRALAEAIAGDGDAEVRLNATVERVERNGDEATLTLADGERLNSAAVVVTLPLQALDSIEFAPALSPGKRAAIAAGQISCGCKAWIRLRGEYEPFVVLGGADWPLTFLQAEYHDEGDTLVVAFGRDALAIDLDDRAAVQKQIRRLVPEAEVLDVAAHDWVADPLSQQTWPMQKAGQLTASLTELQRPEGPLLLAGSDYANGWAGFIDGAIESGLRAARIVDATLGASVASAPKPTPTIAGRQ